MHKHEKQSSPLILVRIALYGVCPKITVFNTLIQFILALRVRYKNLRCVQIRHKVVANHAVLSRHGNARNLKILYHTHLHKSIM